MKKSAADIGFGLPALEARGHEALERRVTRAHEEFVASDEGRIVVDHQFIER
jgi:hypothetical protein